MLRAADKRVKEAAERAKREAVEREEKRVRQEKAVDDELEALKKKLGKR
jgi:hypothetical protein